MFNKNIPLLETKKNGKNTLTVAWITKGILQSRKIKNMLYKEKLKYPNENKEPIYKTYREKFDKK